MFRLARLILFVGIGFYLGYKYKEMQMSSLAPLPCTALTCAPQEQTT